MPDDFKLPPCARFRNMMPLQRQMLLRNLALWLVLVFTFLGAMSLARGAEVKSKPSPRASEVQPGTKIEIVPDTRPLPVRAGRVNDTADLLKAEDRARIEQALEQYERETFHQIAVLTIPTLAGEPIDSYSLRVANAWKLGQKGIDNGMLLVVAVNERIVRIELAPGMEKYVSNDDANEVIEEHIIPSFKRGDYTRGIQAGVIELMRLGRRFAVKKDDVERAKRK
jgi:TLP18.3/Psb32/MOLO-1 phosphatase superfamily protein